MMALLGHFFVMHGGGGRPLAAADFGLRHVFETCSFAEHFLCHLFIFQNRVLFGHSAILETWAT